MKNITRTNGAHRTVRSRLGSFAAAAAASALLIGGFALINASPASAATGTVTQMVWTTEPVTQAAGLTENVSVSLENASNAVVTTGTGSTDTVSLSIVPTVSGNQVTGAQNINAVAGVASFSLVFNAANTGYVITADDTSAASESETVANSPSSSFDIDPGNASKLGFVTEPPASSTLGANFGFTVAVQDSNGNTVTTGGPSTDTIQVNPSGTGCTLNSNPSVAAVAGVATFSGVNFTNGTNCTLVATDTTVGDTGFTSATSTGISLFGAPSKVAFTTPLPPITATVSVVMSPFKVSIEDSNGNVITSGTDSTDTISLTESGGCVLGGTVTEVAVAGVATFNNVSFTSGSTCALVAADATHTLTTANSASISLATSAASKVGFTAPLPPTTATAGLALSSFDVAVEESNGTPISSVTTGATDTITLTSTTCKLAGTTSVAAVGGVAVFSTVSIQTSGSCTLTATDTTRSLTTGTSSAITVSAGTPTHVSYTTAPPTTASSTTTALTTFKVSVEDVYGNVTTSGVGSTDTISITSPCTLIGTTSIAAVAGVATFSAVTVTTGGTCVLTATDTSRSITTATATTTVGSPQATLTVTSKKGTVGTALKLTTSGGSGTGAVTYAVVNGTATCTLSGTSLKANKVGTCIVTATKAASSTYALAISAATTISFGPAGPKATRVVGAITSGRTSTVTVTGSGFSGRPRIISNVAGFSARVTKDTGKSLTVVVTVRGGIRAGTHVMTIILANGKRTSVKYTLH